jgi:hypothetical protein
MTRATPRENTCAARQLDASILDGVVALGILPDGTKRSPFTTPAAAAPALRVTSTLRLPHLLHRSRFTKVAVGVSGMMARRDSDAPVNTPTCRQLRHSTVTVGSPRNAGSDLPE